jgi:hypothetical protein
LEASEAWPAAATDAVDAVVVRVGGAGGRRNRHKSAQLVGRQALLAHQLLGGQLAPLELVNKLLVRGLAERLLLAFQRVANAVDGLRAALGAARVEVVVSARRVLGHEGPLRRRLHDLVPLLRVQTASRDAIRSTTQWTF